MTMALVKPATEYLESYVVALQRGWSPNTLDEDERFEELEGIATDAQAFLASLDDREAKRGPVRLPDGSFVARLPSFRRWMWDGEFAGSIGFRWKPGTPDLPPTCLGHIGYSVVPWKRRLGYATAALALLLPEARDVGLPYVDIVVAPENVASQRVVEANGGVLVERFRTGPAYGDDESLRFRIRL